MTEEVPIQSKDDYGYPDPEDTKYNIEEDPETYTPPTRIVNASHNWPALRRALDGDSE